MALTVRTARGEDREQILALQGERNGADIVSIVGALFDDDEVGPDRFTVADDDGRIVSSLCLMTETLRLGDVTIPTGQIEFVATAADHEHQGFVRRQMDIVHELSRERGDLVQVIGGISYFYRRFGYEYAIAFPRVRVLRTETVGLPDGWMVRQATVDDVDAVIALQDEVQTRMPLTSSRSRRWWAWELSQSDTEWHVAVRDGVVRGAASIGDGLPFYGTISMVRTPAAAEANAARALLADAATRGKPVAFEERPTLTTVANGTSHRHPRTYALYVRVPDLVALLDRVRPALTTRLASSPHAGTSGAMLLSTYSSSLQIRYEAGEVIAVEPGPPIQNPTGMGGAGVPPDLVATLVFGRYGAAGLAERHDDVDLGRVADLMDIFFPKVEADLIFTN